MPLARPARDRSQRPRRAARGIDIQKDRFSWEADRTVDGGKTWIKRQQTIEARRIGPPRSLPALAPPRP
jgi:hypothetical protein